MTLLCIFPTRHLTDEEIQAWFNLVDTNDDNKITAAELDTAHAIFGAKCSLTDKVNK